MSEIEKKAVEAELEDEKLDEVAGGVSPETIRAAGQDPLSKFSKKD